MYSLLHDFISMISQIEVTVSIQRLNDSGPQTLIADPGYERLSFLS